MAVLFAWLFSLALRMIVSLRYRIQVRGWDNVVDSKPPILFLPNHPGFIDPVLIFSILFRQFRPRLIVFEGNFPRLIRVLLVRLLRVVEVPDLSRPSQEARQRTEGAVAEVIAGLRRGESFILWPSGRVQRDGVERLGSVRALTDLLVAVPNATVVAIRTRGIWGSMFSFARTGKLPELGPCLVRGALILASNLALLTPRRPVSITLEEIDRNRLPKLDRELVNRWFEDWYNAGGTESPQFVPYHFLFGPRHFEYQALMDESQPRAIDNCISEPTRDAVLSILSEQLHRDLKPEDLKGHVRLDEFGLDSLQRMELAMAVEQRFGQKVDSTPETLDQLFEAARGIRIVQSLKAPPLWFRQPRNPAPLKVMGETIPEAFVARALATPRDIAAADDISGVMTYERLLVGAILLARRFAIIPASHIGILLPASVAADLVLLGAYLAGKVPVLLNWTTGPANLQHSVQLTELTHVVSSRRLRDRLNLQIQGCQFLDVEDLRQQTGWFEKLTVLIAVKTMPGYIRRSVPEAAPSDRAVILFTSGSEKAPKAVPLSHRNLISNMRIVPAILSLDNHDAILGFLPMFHSFGFTMTGLFPLLGGIRVVHHPDPTDSAGLVWKIESYKTTVFVGMPSLMARVFDHAEPSQLKSLRLIAVGAEQCPQRLFDLAHKMTPDAELLEGYGVTECSPVVTGNCPGAKRTGTIGRALPGVEVCVVDLESHVPVDAGHMGMLLVAGPGVFQGYLGDEQSPFLEIGGKRWYVTGDLAEMDRDGFIIFRGRLKRFIKAGGEMISLPALEQPFLRRFPEDDEGPRIAVEAIEMDEGRRIVLFTRAPVTLREANELLTQEGFRGVMRLDEVRLVDRIPLMGGGKVDYRKLRSMITDERPLNQPIHAATIPSQESTRL